MGSPVDVEFILDMGCSVDSIWGDINVTPERGPANPKSTERYYDANPSHPSHNMILP